MDKLVSDAELIVRVDRVLKRPDNFVIGDVLGLFEDLRAALTAPRPLEVGEGEVTEALREARRLVTQYAEFFCEEDYDPLVDMLDRVLAVSPAGQLDPSP